MKYTVIVENECYNVEASSQEEAVQKANNQYRRDEALRIMDITGCCDEEDLNL
jgi:hypothetical protein